MRIKTDSGIAMRKRLSNEKTPIINNGQNQMPCFPSASAGKTKKLYVDIKVACLSAGKKVWHCGSIGEPINGVDVICDFWTVTLTIFFGFIDVYIYFWTITSTIKE